MYKNFQISVLMDFYGDFLSPTQRDVINYYYNHDLSLSEISDNLGITRQGVRDSIKRAENILLDAEKKLGMAEKDFALKEGIEQIRQNIYKIKRCGISNQASRYAEKIIVILDSLCK